MSATSKNFEPREAIEGLFGYVKEMATSTLNRGPKAQPNEDRVETAVLAALESGSKTAGQITKAIALAAGGTWTPTDGQISKTLAKLAEVEKVSVKTKADRKTYTLTDAGQAALAEAKEATTEAAAANPSKTSANLSWLACEPNFLKSASKLPPVMLDLAQTGTREQQIKAAQILDKARHDLHAVLAEK